MAVSVNVLIDHHMAPCPIYSNHLLGSRSCILHLLVTPTFSTLWVPQGKVYSFYGSNWGSWDLAYLWEVWLLIMLMYTLHGRSWELASRSQENVPIMTSNISNLKSQIMPSVSRWGDPGRQEHGPCKASRSTESGADAFNRRVFGPDSCVASDSTRPKDYCWWGVVAYIFKKNSGVCAGCLFVHLLNFRCCL